jgi:hypothetical protein
MPLTNQATRAGEGVKKEEEKVRWKERAKERFKLSFFTFLCFNAHEGFSVGDSRTRPRSTFYFLFILLLCPVGATKRSEVELARLRIPRGSTTVEKSRGLFLTYLPRYYFLYLVLTLTHLIKKLHTWVWNCIPGYETAYLGMKLNTWVWRYIPGHETTHLSMKLYTWVWNYILRNTQVWNYTPRYTRVWNYIPGYETKWNYLPGCWNCF